MALSTAPPAAVSNNLLGLGDLVDECSSGKTTDTGQEYSI